MNRSFYKAMRPGNVSLAARAPADLVVAPTDGVTVTVGTPGVGSPYAYTLHSAPPPS